MTQHPSNDKRKAFWLFMLYFSITAAVIVFIGFYGLKAPLKENNRLKNDMESFQKEKAFNSSFSGLMNNARSMIMDSLKGDTSFLNLQITDSLKKIKMLVDRDSLVSKDIYLNAITALNNLQESKQQLRATVGIDQKIKDLKDQIDKKGAELNNMNEISKLTDSKNN